MREEFERFYRNNLRLVYALALAQDANGERAEDRTQETFFRAWRHFDRLARLDAPAQRAWLVRSLGNLVIDGWRRERTATLFDPPDPARPSVGESGERGAALRLDVLRALSTLGTTDRQIVILRYFLEMNSREIGEALGMSEGTVRSRLSACRKALAERLSDWNPEGDHGG